MDKEDFLNKMADTEINKETVKKIESKYGCSLPEDVQKIISISKEQLFFDEERRLLSSNEIENASEQLHVDFKKKFLVPVIDAYDNDFICFNYKTKKWCYFNIVDETLFSESESLEAIL